ncbi:MAG: folate-binding protein [Acidobacteriia bacterium]|nr:folate-binding protein [Terriglobia bacterium]
MSTVIPHDRAPGAPSAEQAVGIRAEFDAIRYACGLYDLGSRAQIALTGNDRVRWLNGMVTNNVRDMANGHGAYAFLLNPQGHILADLYAYNRSESLLVDVDQSQLEKVLQIFDHYIIMDDVEVTNLSEKLATVGVAGPKAPAVLHSAGIEVPPLQALQFTDVVWKDGSVTVVRTDNESVVGYELRLEPGNLPALRDALLRAGAKPVGAPALELLRIACGIPRYGQDIRERDLPQETEQQRALHFSKGCYIGQEIVERIRSRGAVHRKFTGFYVDGRLPAPGTKVQADGKDVGEITSAASLPVGSGERAVALGYIRREMAAPGKQLQAGTTQLTIATLPFKEVLEH